MDIVLEKASDTNASLIITLRPDDYKAEVAKKLKQYGKQVSLKGFRPGHVPAAIVQKMYGKGILIDEVNSLLTKNLSAYIRENKLQVVGDPIPEQADADAIDWESQEEFRFTYQLGLASDFDVDLAAMDAVPRFTILVGDTEVDETIERLKTQFQEQQHVDEAAEGDMIFGELKQAETPEAAAPDSADRFETKTALPLAKVAPDALGTFIGRKKDETFTFVMENAFPDLKDRALATGAKKETVENLTGEFSFTIEDVTRNVPAELNQAFFDKVLGMGVVEDEAAFRTKLQEIIGQNYTRESDSLLQYTLEEALLNNTLISLPDDFLKAWLLETNQGKVTAEQIEEQYPDFSKSSKLQLIKNKVAEKADLNVSFEEVLNAARQMIREQFGFAAGMGDDMNEMIDKIAKNYLADDKEDRKNYNTTFNRVFEGKIMEHIKSQVRITDEAVSLDGFRERANQRQ